MSAAALASCRLRARAQPGDALRALSGRRLPFMLIGAWQSGVMLGCDPVSVVSGAGALDAADGEQRGWWAGYLGYRLGAGIERLPPAPPRASPLPDAQLALYESVLCQERDGGWLLKAVNAVVLDERVELFEQLLAQVAPARGWSLSKLRPAGGGDRAHLAAVAECTRRIAAGDLFQANLCLRFEGEFQGSSADAFAAAADATGPAYGAYIGTGSGAILSFSPELFLKRSGDLVVTAPIKGTAVRPANPAAAQAAQSMLAASGKDHAENVMIVDLMRNDLGRVARFGSVQPDAQPVVEAHPGVWHLVTRVRAQLRDGVGSGELLRACFPPGSVTGAPKVQAMKEIAELEGSSREVYTGAVGVIEPGGDLEFNVAIRTLEVSGDQAWLGAGGGIVADSGPEAELREAYAKAAPIAAALGSTLTDPAVDPAVVEAVTGSWGRRLRQRPDPAKGLYETVLVRARKAVEIEPHLQRLANSAHRLYGVQLPPDTRERALAQAASCADEVARMRLLLSPGGELEVTLTAASADNGPLSLAPVTVAGGLGPHKLRDRAPLLEFESPGRAALICDAGGDVLEASYANIWALIDGRLITPPADGRILPGTVRARLLEMGSVGPYRTGARRLTLSEVLSAQALLTTSSIRIAAPVSVAGRRIAPTSLGLAAMVTLVLGDLSARVNTE